MTQTALVIDADILLWESCMGCEQPYDWGDDFWTLHCDAREAKQRFDNDVATLKEKLNARSVVMALSGPKNFRKDVLPTYKSNRKKTRRPVAFHAVKNYIREAYPTYEFENIEADDVCGMLMTGMYQTKFEKVLVSTDKDLKQIPGLHYNPGHPEDGVFEVNKFDAYYNFLMQVLTGDAVDGYSGCPGVGPVGAKKVLDPDPCWVSVKNAYDKAGLTEEDALVQARVAYILRRNDYDRKTQTVKLWRPKP